jgi:outer membrane protein assembly factor BamB
MGKVSKLKNILGISLVILSFHILLALTAVMADDGEWPQFQKDKKNSGQTQSSAPTSSVRVAWSVFTHYSSTHGIDVTPIVANGKVFVVDVDEYAWAFDAVSGDTLWSTPLVNGPRFTLATPAYGDGKVFFATDTGYIYALDEAGGNILWSGRLTEGTGQDEELTTQVVDASGDGTDPDIIWSYDVEGKRYNWWSGPAVIGDFLVFGDTDSVVTSVDKNTGAWKDELNLSTEYGITAGWIRSAITTNQANTRIYLTSKNGYLFAIGFDALSGELNPSDGWFVSIGDYSASTPTVYSGKVCVCSGSFCEAGGLYCFDESSGAQLWSYPFGSYGSEASPALSLQDGSFYIYITTDTASGEAYCFDQDGNVVWQYLPDHPEYILQGVVIAGGKVFFCNDAGYLYALESCPDWDVNQDGYINIADVGLVGLHWGETGEQGWIREDVNKDGSINVGDVGLIGLHWGE